MGPGGAGTSTVAAAGAVGVRRSSGRLAGPGRRGKTLVVSLDRFHVLSGIFGVFSVPGQPIPASQQVDLLELDTLEMLADTWSTVRSALATGALTGTAIPGSDEVLAGLDPEEILGMPGVESLLALRRIRDEAASGKWSQVVVDTSGAVDPFELFRIPQMVADTIERLWPRHRRLGAATDNTRIARVVAVLDALIRDCSDIDDLLFDSSGVSAHLVVGADDHGVLAARRHQAVLQVMGLPLTSVLVNRMLPDVSVDVDVTSQWYARRVADQRLCVEQLREIGGEAELLCLPWLSDPIDSVLRMRELGARLDSRPIGPVGPGAAEVARESGSGVDSVYRMRWRQSLPDPSGLKLGRSGDDLMITVSGVRKRVRLPSVLRRCVVAGAHWDDGFMTVRFRPDPDLWPSQS
jgi:arsenite/tail-anchored protein-transporting ATPase